MSALVECIATVQCPIWCLSGTWILLVWHWPGDGGAFGNGKGVGMWRDWEEEVGEVWRPGGLGV